MAEGVEPHFYHVSVQIRVNHVQTFDPLDAVNQQTVDKRAHKPFGFAGNVYNRHFIKVVAPFNSHTNIVIAKGFYITLFNVKGVVVGMPCAPIKRRIVPLNNFFNDTLLNTFFAVNHCV